MANILEVANDIVNNRSEEKERMYGPFGGSMHRAAEMFRMLRNKDFNDEDAFWFMICLKLSREAVTHKEDNLLDACAYMGALNNKINDIEPEEK